MPTTSVSITPTSAGSIGLFGTGAGTSFRNQGGPTSATSNFNWDRANGPTSTSSSTERPAFARASLPATYNGIGERGNGTTSPSLTERPAFARASLPATSNGMGDRGIGSAPSLSTERPAFARVSLPTTLNEQRAEKEN